MSNKELVHLIVLLCSVAAIGIGFMLLVVLDHNETNMNNQPENDVFFNDLDTQVLFLHVAEIRKNEIQALDMDSMSNEEVLSLYVQYRPLINKVWESSDGLSMRQAVVKWRQEFLETKK